MFASLVTPAATKIPTSRTLHHRRAMADRSLRDYQEVFAKYAATAYQRNISGRYTQSGRRFFILNTVKSTSHAP